MRLNRLPASVSPVEDCPPRYSEQARDLAVIQTGFYKLQHTPILVERSHPEPKVDTNMCSYDTARAGRS
jgi:hypothetical protein